VPLYLERTSRFIILKFSYDGALFGAMFTEERVMPNVNPSEMQTPRSAE